MSRLLLLSNSTQHGYDYLAHAASEIQDFLGRAITRVLFVPYALADRNGYAGKARTAFARLGYGLDAIHEAPHRMQPDCCAIHTDARGDDRSSPRTVRRRPSR